MTRKTGTVESIWYVVYAGTICPKVLSVESTPRAAVQAITLASTPATVQPIKATTATEAAERAQAFLDTMSQSIVTQTMERTAAQQASDVDQLNELAKTLSEGAGDQGILTYRDGPPMFTSSGPIPELNATIGEPQPPRFLTITDIDAAVREMRDYVPTFGERQVVASDAYYTWLFSRSEAYEAERKARLEAEGQLLRTTNDLALAMAEQIPGHCKGCKHLRQREGQRKKVTWCAQFDIGDYVEEIPEDGSGFCWKFEAKS